MPSPFPGMDPYLEASYIWPDFHDALAGEIRNQLNASLPAPFYARLEMRPEVGIVAQEKGRRITSDVAVAKPAGQQPSTESVAVLEAPRETISESLEVTIQNEPIRHQFVEIRDPENNHHLITLIEIASPSNKRPGADQKSYFKKQREILESDATLIELDLLRDGDRLLANVELADVIEKLEPAPDYLVLVNRSWRRAAAEMSWQIFSIQITEPLPCIPVPLRENQEEVPLDLQYLVNRVYDNGPYRRGAVDYGRPPDPPLPPALQPWAKTCIDRYFESK